MNILNTIGIVIAPVISHSHGCHRGDPKLAAAVVIVITSLSFLWWIIMEIISYKKNKKIVFDSYPFTNLSLALGTSRIFFGIIITIALISGLIFIVYKCLN